MANDRKFPSFLRSEEDGSVFLWVEGVTSFEELIQKANEVNANFLGIWLETGGSMHRITPEAMTFLKLGWQLGRQAISCSVN